MNVRAGFLPRQALLDLAAYDLSKFMALRHRGHLPFDRSFGFFAGKRNGYPAWLAVALVVGDLVVKHTSMSRDDFAEYSDAYLPRVIAGFHNTVDGKAGWLAVFQTALETDFRFGTRQEMNAKADEHGDKLQVLTLISVEQAFLEIDARAKRAGITIAGKEEAAD